MDRVAQLFSALRWPRDDLRRHYLLPFPFRRRRGSSVWWDESVLVCACGAVLLLLATYPIDMGRGERDSQSSRCWEGVKGAGGRASYGLIGGGGQGGTRQFQWHS